MANVPRLMDFKSKKKNEAEEELSVGFSWALPNSPTNTHRVKRKEKEIERRKVHSSEPTTTTASEERSDTENLLRLSLSPDDSPTLDSNWYTYKQVRKLFIIRASSQQQTEEECTAINSQTLQLLCAANLKWINSLSAAALAALFFFYDFFSSLYSWKFIHVHARLMPVELLLRRKKVRCVCILFPTSTATIKLTKSWNLSTSIIH